MDLYLSDLLQKDYNALCEKFQSALFNSPDKRTPQLYLKNRGFDKKTVDKFRIGWCPPGAKVRERLNHLRGRLIFPTVDEYGDVRSFSGRLLADKKDIKEGEKRWWNESYNKSFFLYGLDVAVPNIIKKNKVIIVEGQTDVVSCHKHGFDVTVGLMSDDLNVCQISKIFRFTNNIFLMLDGDKAGRKASRNIRFKRFMQEKTSGFTSCREVIRIYDVDLITEGNEYDPDSFLSEFGKDFLVEKINKSIRRQEQK